MRSPLNGDNMKKITTGMDGSSLLQQPPWLKVGILGVLEMHPNIRDSYGTKITRETEKIGVFCMTDSRKDFRVLEISMSSLLARKGCLPMLERATQTQHLPLNVCLFMGHGRILLFDPYFPSSPCSMALCFGLSQN